MGCERLTLRVLCQFAGAKEELHRRSNWPVGWREKQLASWLELVSPELLHLPTSSARFLFHLF
jgi:hypothetical protein